MTALSVPITSITPHDERTERRALLEEQWRQQIADITELAYEALTPVDEEDEDGSRASELHVNTQLLAAARQQLAETEAALARLDDGSYGLCVDCSNPISAARLEILPAARYCVACQATRSRRR
jgi:RNA polymerase-binding transcription factor DksA